MTRLRRAVLVVPATSWAKLEKAAGLDVDEVVIDLEDAVPDSLKTDETRHQAADAIAWLAWRAPTLAVRVNPFGTPWFEDDIAEIVEHGGQRLACIVLPKVELAEAVMAAVGTIDAARPAPGSVSRRSSKAHWASSAWRASRRPRRASRPSSSEPETTRPRWASRWPASVPSSPPTPAISGRTREHGSPWPPRLRARSDRRPYGALRDLDGLAESARRARALGFGGKWAIHPDQIGTCMVAFSSTAEEQAAAEKTLATWTPPAGRAMASRSAAARWSMRRAGARRHGLWSGPAGPPTDRATAGGCPGPGRRTVRGRAVGRLQLATWARRSSRSRTLGRR